MDKDLPAARKLIQNQTDDWRDMNIEKESPEERELFERMRARQQIDNDFDTEYAKTMTGLMDELALARVLIRELGDRLAKLEGKQ